MSNDKRKPAASFKDGVLEVAVWPNEKDGRIWYNLTLSRSYKADKDSDEWTTETIGLNGDQALSIGHLMSKAHEAIRTLPKREG